MKNKSNLWIFAVGALLLALVLLLFRQCGDGKKTVPPAPAVTVDTTTTWRKDSTWNTPALPAPTPPDGGNFQAEADHYRHRYEHYKAEALRRAAELAALQSLLDSLGTDCPEASALGRELAMYREQWRADSAYIAELSEQVQLRRYAGTDSLPEYVHHYDITVLGSLPPGGYKYKTDFVQRTIERTVTLPAPKVRRNALTALVGLTIDDLRGTNARPVYALQYQLSGERLVATWQVGYPAQGMAGVGIRW